MANHDYISTTDGEAMRPGLCSEPDWTDEGLHYPEACGRELPCPVHDFLRRESERNERSVKYMGDLMDRVFNLAAGRSTTDTEGGAEQ